MLCITGQKESGINTLENSLTFLFFFSFFNNILIYFKISCLYVIYFDLTHPLLLTSSSPSLPSNFTSSFFIVFTNSLGPYVHSVEPLTETRESYQLPCSQRRVTPHTAASVAIKLAVCKVRPTLTRQATS